MAGKTRVAALALGVHVVANLAHGVPHLAAPVPLAPWQSAFVVGVVLLAPLVGFQLLRRGRPRGGAWLFAVSMAASLAFGLTFHFGVPNPDHVDAVAAGPWHRPFGTTATLVAVTDAVGVLVGLWLVSKIPDSSVGVGR
ncbi:hypothetical protein [Halorussus aquaticus]|uniref:Uncharacterized protein n=1 Tax=Halorussus aquaticus TaxID=2953748 RepID=A0ABD5PX22_9EURY|nr:hypothetical protein [Halorussus aquaticus]